MAIRPALTVSSIIERLKAMPQDAEVYFAKFDYYVNDDKDPIPPPDVSKFQTGTIYSVTCNHKTMWTWSVMDQAWKSYTAAIFECETA